MSAFAVLVVVFVATQQAHASSVDDITANWDGDQPLLTTLQSAWREFSAGHGSKAVAQQLSPDWLARMTHLNDDKNDKNKQQQNVDPKRKSEEAVKHTFDQLNHATNVLNSNKAPDSGPEVLHVHDPNSRMSGAEVWNAIRQLFTSANRSLHTTTQDKVLDYYAWAHSIEKSPEQPSSWGQMWDWGVAKVNGEIPREQPTELSQSELIRRRQMFESSLSADWNNLVGNRKTPYLPPDQFKSLLDANRGYSYVLGEPFLKIPDVYTGKKELHTQLYPIDPYEVNIRGAEERSFHPKLPQRAPPVVLDGSQQQNSMPGSLMPVMQPRHSAETSIPFSISESRSPSSIPIISVNAKRQDDNGNEMMGDFLPEMKWKIPTITAPPKPFISQSTKDSWNVVTNSVSDVADSASLGFNQKVLKNIPRTEDLSKVPYYAKQALLKTTDTVKSTLEDSAETVVELLPFLVPATIKQQLEKMQQQQQQQQPSLTLATTPTTIPTTMPTIIPTLRTTTRTSPTTKRAFNINQQLTPTWLRGEVTAPPPTTTTTDKKTTQQQQQQQQQVPESTVVKPYAKVLRAPQQQQQQSATTPKTPKDYW